MTHHFNSIAFYRDYRAILPGSNTLDTPSGLAHNATLQVETSLGYTNGSVRVMSDESRSLYSPLSISRELLPWSVWVICLLTVIWTVLTAWGEVSSRRHADILDTSLAVGSNAADSVPLIIIYSILGVMVGTLHSGRWNNDNGASYQGLSVRQDRAAT